MTTVIEKIEAIVYKVVAPKTYLTAGEVTLLWGRILTPWADHLSPLLTLIRAVAVPFILPQFFRDLLKLRRRLVVSTDVSTVVKGSVCIGRSLRKGARAATWLAKVNFLHLSSAMAYRIGMVGGICGLLAHALKFSFLIGECFDKETIDPELSKKCLKAGLRWMLTVLAFIALYQATVLGSLIALCLKTADVTLKLV